MKKDNNIKWLENFVKRIEKIKIPYSESTSWSRANDEGFNDGLIACSNEVKKRIKYLNEKNKKNKVIL